MVSGEISVVLVNKFGPERLVNIFAALSAQSIASQLRLIVVSPFAPPNSTTYPFASIQHVPFAPIVTMGPARAAAVMACSTPFLQFAEDHCFPAPGCAEALLKRLEAGYVGVGPFVLNHNPATCFSRADYFLNYGCFGPGSGSGEAQWIAPHQSAYRTDVLQKLGGELAGLLELDVHLVSRLAAEGARLYVEPSARVAHTNLSRSTAHWRSQFNGNRVYGATRVRYESWNFPRRLIYAAAWPAIAGLRLLRA
jgi:GT2 family glycosyltransferase